MSSGASATNTLLNRSCSEYSLISGISIMGASSESLNSELDALNTNKENPFNAISDGLGENSSVAKITEREGANVSVADGQHANAVGELGKLRGEIQRLEQERVDKELQVTCLKFEAKEWVKVVQEAKQHAHLAKQEFRQVQARIQKDTEAANRKLHMAKVESDLEATRLQALGARCAEMSKLLDELNAKCAVARKELAKSENAGK